MTVTKTEETISEKSDLVKNILLDWVIARTQENSLWWCIFGRRRPTRALLPMRGPSTSTTAAWTAAPKQTASMSAACGVDRDLGLKVWMVKEEKTGWRSY